MIKIIFENFFLLNNTFILKMNLIKCAKFNSVHLILFLFNFIKLNLLDDFQKIKFPNFSFLFLKLQLQFLFY